MTQSPDLLDRLANLVGQATRAGADAADAVVAQSRGLEVAYRMGERESLERAESLDLGLRVFVGDRTASVASGDLSEKTLAALVERAVAMAKAAPPDPSVLLASADQLSDGAMPPGLDLIDDGEPTPEQLADMAVAAEAAMLEVSGVTNSEGAGASWGRTDIALATTNGFTGAYGRTSFGFSTTAIAEQDGLMERDYDYASATHLGDLAAAAVVGKTAGQRAVRRLGAKRVKSQAVPVVFEQRLAGGLLRSLAVLRACDRPDVACVELGLPFSDPVADGPVLQAAAARALDAGTTFDGLLATLRALRAGDDDHAGSALPVVVMGYLNPLERYGYTEFSRDAAAAGVDGILLVDDFSHRT